MEVSLPLFSKVNVLVTGDIMLDRYWHGLTTNISPEAPVPVVQVNSIIERPGGAANVAMNIASVGASCRLIGLIGEDHEANILNKALEDFNVSCDFIIVKNHPTITKLRVLSHNQQLIRLDFEKKFSQFDTKELKARIQKYLNSTNVLVLSDYGKGTLCEVQTIIQVAREIGVLVLVDPKAASFEHYRGATLLTPNFSEFEIAVGKCKNEEEIISRGMQLVSNYDLCALLITRSEKGMSLLQRNKVPLYFPTKAREVFDVTGAGDTVIAILATVLATGKSLEEACVIANIAAGLVVGKLGTSTVSIMELENALQASISITYGVVSEMELKIAISKSRQRQEKLVMTNGVFDILHAGHVKYLSKARKLGDRLIVAVNSDTSTKRIKGKNRPINSLDSRMLVLAGLKSVDWVVSFEEDTPQRLISELLPDFLVKGGDYKINNIAGAAEVRSNGGEVHVLNFEPFFSSTNIIEKLLQN